MKELILIIVGSALVNNIILSQFQGLCPFLGVSKKVDTSIGMGAAVIFVITLASIRESIEDNDIPYNFQGSPIVLITSGLMAIAFMGFSGLI